MKDADLAELQSRIDRLEAESAVRNVLARYMELCDALDESTPMDELAALFTRHALWMGKGGRYRAAFGEHRGREAIAAMLGSFRGPPPHFALNAHFLSSERIDASKQPVVGRWMMLQTSTYANGKSELRAARLTIEFAFEEARWRISRFETENIFSRSTVSWDENA